MKLVLLINIKMPTTVDILLFSSKINFMLSQVEHEKSVMTSGARFSGNKTHLFPA